MRKLLYAIGLMTLAFSCSNDDSVNPDNIVIDDNFNASTKDWVSGFADYPSGMEEEWEIYAKHSKLPAPLDTTKSGIKLQGWNRSDDLFMYLSKKVSTGRPETEYKGTFEVEFATNAAEGSVGVGGSPANSVYFGIGITNVEPKKMIDSTNNYVTVNFQKMQQASNGGDMKVIGDVSNGKDKFEYTLVKRTGEFTGKTDKNGDLWLLVGTDSGFESLTALYYTNIKVKLDRVK
jgi:hypothetical protein